MFYKRVCCGLNDRGTLVPENEVSAQIKNPEKDYYVSIYEYNEIQYKHFLEHNTIAGITDVTTTNLVFDFDSKDDLQLARTEALEVINRLEIEYNVPWDAIQAYFSGKKGFTLLVETNLTFTPTQLKELCYKQIGKGLQTLDSSLYNASRILRMPFTKHQETGFYKIPLSRTCINEYTIKGIQTIASKIENAKNLNYSIAQLDESIIPKIQPKSLVISSPKEFLDFTLKPKWLTSCRWSLLNGRFHEGDRSSALLCLASTYKNQGFPLDITYRMLKGVAELQAKYTSSERFPDEEIYNNIVTQIYSSNWRGGQFSCRDKDSWLYDYCQSLGVHRCQHNFDKLTVKTNEVFQLFYDYTQNYEKNVLYTGIKSLDEKVKLLVGTSNAIVGPPGVGKTSLVFDILNYNSKQGVNSIFFSYDMFHSPVYMRMIQRHTGKSQDEIYHIFKNDKKEADKIESILTKEYRNVEFCFKSGQTPDEIIETIKVTQEKIGQKIKLIVIDYNELVTASVNDPTAASAEVAQKIRQIANEQEVCAVTLLQPSKIYTNPTEEIRSLTGAKGSSSISQSLTLMLGLSRPGYNTRFPEIDKFFNINCLKNRNGPLFSLDFHWDGLRGMVDELNDEERTELDMVRNKNEEEKKKQNGGW
jgi:replicative DNA helicase